MRDRLCGLRGLSQGTANDCQEFCIVHGFLEKGHRPCGERAIAICFGVASGDDNDRY